MSKAKYKATLEDTGGLYLAMASDWLQVKANFSESYI